MDAAIWDEYFPEAPAADATPEERTAWQRRVLMTQAPDRFIIRDTNKPFPYLSHWYFSEVLNHVFGPDAWGREIVSLKVEDVRDVTGGTKKMVAVTATCAVRVTIRWADGTVTQQSGVGVGANVNPTVCDAMDTACKAAESDAFKRALKDCPVFGLDLYEPEWGKPGRQLGRKPRAGRNTREATLGEQRQQAVEQAVRDRPAPPERPRYNGPEVVGKAQDGPIIIEGHVTGGPYDNDRSSKVFVDEVAVLAFERTARQDIGRCQKGMLVRVYGKDGEWNGKRQIQASAVLPVRDEDRSGPPAPPDDVPPPDDSYAPIYNDDDIPF